MGGSVRVGWTKKNMTPEKIVQWKIISTLIGVLGTHGVQGFKMWPIILKIVEIVRTELKNHQFLEFKFENLKKLKKSCKKLDQILRTLVEKKNQILTVLLDKIQIE
jgi:hypothetical protein